MRAGDAGGPIRGANPDQEVVRVSGKTAGSDFNWLFEEFSPENRRSECAVKFRSKLSGLIESRRCDIGHNSGSGCGTARGKITTGDFHGQIRYRVRHQVNQVAALYIGIG